MKTKTAPEIFLEKEKCLAAYEWFKKAEAGKSPSWLASYRDEAIARFRDQSFPTVHDEAWKYTSLEPFAKLAFRPVYRNDSGRINSHAVKNLLGKAPGPRLVFINGLYAPLFSSTAGLEGNIKMVHLGASWNSEGRLAERSWFPQENVRLEIFADLNSAFLNDGMMLQLPENFLVKTPLECVYLTLPENQKLVSYPRNLIVAEPGSSAVVVERYLGLGGNPYFTNAVTDYVIREGASVEAYRLQKETRQACHISSTRVSVGRQSRFVFFNMDFGGRLVRNHLSVVFSEEGGECDLNGLYLAGEGQHIDNHTVIDHLKPKGTSRQLYKGILGSRSRAVFSGKIFVRQDAQKTDAAQKNKNLLLSSDARVDTRPQLEILADDVKCAHGAAVGQLNEDEIFYLRSRGLGVKEAKKVLTYGFAHEIVDKVGLGAVKEELEHWLEDRLESVAHKEEK